MPITNRYSDAVQLVEEVQKYLGEHPEARERLRWADSPATNYHRLTVGSRSWEISTTHAWNNMMFLTLDARDKLLRTLKGQTPPDRLAKTIWERLG